MSDAAKTPDALYVPHRLLTGTDAIVRASQLATIGRKFLATPDGPPPVCSPIEQQGDVCYHFVRRTMADSKLFPTGHPRSGEVRHEWADGPDGIRLGYSKGD